MNDDDGGCGSDSDYSMKKLRFGRNRRFWRRLREIVVNNFPIQVKNKPQIKVWNKMREEYEEKYEKY